MNEFNKKYDKTVSEKLIAKLEKFIKQKQKDWKQESIEYKFEDDFYVYPNFD